MIFVVEIYSIKVTMRISSGMRLYLAGWCSSGTFFFTVGTCLPLALDRQWILDTMTSVDEF